MPLEDDSSNLESLPGEHRPRGIISKFKSSLSKAFRIRASDGHRDRPQRHEDRENNGYWFVKSHICHGIADIILSLLCVAVVINSM